jgi:hypothetical protein
VGHDDDRVALLELGDEVLDRQGRDRVQGAARLVHEQDLRLDGDRPRDAEPLLLAAGEAGARTRQPLLDLLPEVRPRSDRSTTSSRVAFFLTPLRRSPAATLS